MNGRPETSTAQPRSSAQTRRGRSLFATCYAATVGFGLFGAAALFLGGRLAGGWLGTIASPWVSQCCIGFALLLVVGLAGRRWAASVVAATGLGWSALLVAATRGVVVVPWVPGTATAIIEGAPALRIASVNVLCGNPPDQAKLVSLADLGADVLLVIECTPAWAEALAGLAPTYPHQVHFPRVDAGGIAIASRYPLTDVHVPADPWTRLNCLDAIMETPEGPIRLLGVHPMPPASPELAAIRDDELAGLAGRAARSTLPTIVIGDFNETPYGRALRSFGAESGCSPAIPVGPFAGTWPTRIAGRSVPAFLRIAIDHAFVSQGLAASRIEVGPDIGSDHLPIVVEVGRQRSGESSGLSGSRPR